MIDTRSPACDELFDTVVQSLFGIGLQLEHAIESTEDVALGKRLDVSIRRLHDTIGLISNRGDIHRDACTS